MKHLFRKVAALVGCAALLASGCVSAPTCGTGACGTGACGGTDGMTRPLIDRCYPERYNSLAKREVNHAFAPQVLNGHVLDQTVWNEFFDAGTDKLNPLGQSELQRIARRRPCPDRNVYLATSWDLPYDPACPDRYCGARQELDVARKAAVVKYLVAMNCGRGTEFEVLVHDPSNPAIHSAGPANSIIQMNTRFRGGLPTQGGTSGGIAAGGGGGGGGGR